MALKHFFGYTTPADDPWSKGLLRDMPDGSVFQLQSVFFNRYDLALTLKTDFAILEESLDHFIKSRSSHGAFSGFALVEESLDHFIPQVDYYLSCKNEVEQTPCLRAVLSRYFDGRMLQYLHMLYERGLFWRHGRTVNLTNYCVHIPSLRLRYVWIPKSACTTAKTELLRRVDPEFLIGIPPGAFHECIRTRYRTTIEDLGDPNLCEISLVRHPFARLVSCYLDKFANPILQRRSFEDFAYQRLLRIYALLGIEADPGQRSISFSEFLSYVFSQPAWAYDAHWRPQSHFLGSHVERKLYRTENIGRMLSDLPLDHHDEPPRLNVSAGLAFDRRAPLTGRLFAKLPTEFQSSDIKSYNDFIPKSIYSVLADWLKEDLDLFESAI